MHRQSRFTWMNAIGPLVALCCTFGFLSSCAGSAGAGRGGLSMEKLGNGYLVRIVAENNVGEGSAFVGPDNWLIVTIADSTFQLQGVESFQSPLVDSVEVTPFRTAVQIAFHMTKEVEKVELIRQKPPNEILISLFLKE